MKASLRSNLARFANHADVFGHFAPIEKCGINPNYMVSTTPAGIYAYPMQTVLTAPSLFASDSPYLFLLRPTQQNVIDADCYTVDLFNDDYRKLSDKFGNTVVECAIYDVMARLGPRAHPFRILYGLTHTLRNRVCLGRLPPMASRDSFAWSSILRALGYAGVVDRGRGLISWDIPAQAVFFTKAAIEVVDLIEIPRKRFS